MKISLIPKILLSLTIISCGIALSACANNCEHEYMSEIIVEPTHEKEGRTVHYCLDCDYEYSSNFVPPIGHTLTKELHAPTCSDQGYIYNYCSCGYHFNTSYTAPLGHTLSTEVTEPTCDKEGYTAAHCSVCGYHYTYDVVPPTGHILNIQSTYVSLDNEVANSKFTCEICDLDYEGDYIFYSDIYKGAYVATDTPIAKGIDISYHQHETGTDGNYLPLDWDKIKQAGIDFVILRIGYMGRGNTPVLDPVFEMNYAAAKQAGLDVGAYIFSYAYSLEDAQAEAEFVLSALEGKQFEYPIFLDVEYPPILNNISPEADALTDICCEFINILQKNGYFAAIYTSANWLETNLNTQKVTSLFDVWVAHWITADENTVVNEATWKKEWGQQIVMWQFSQTGNIDGVYYPYKKDENGNPKLVSFDMNYVYRDYPSIIKKYGLNGYEKQKDLTNLDGKYSEGTENSAL